MHYNLRPPDALIKTPYQVWSRTIYLFLSYSVFLLILCGRLWPWSLTIWPWMFVMYRLWRDQTLCQILAKSNNHRLNYSDLNIWLNDLEHVCVTVLRSALRFHQVWTRSLSSRNGAMCVNDWNLKQRSYASMNVRCYPQSWLSLVHAPLSSRWSVLESRKKRRKTAGTNLINQVADCSSSLKLGEFIQVRPDVNLLIHTFKVKGSKVKFTAWHKVAKIRKIMNNSAWDCSIWLKFRTDFDHVRLM